MAIRTAQAMYDYASEHHFAFGYSFKMAKKHFAIIEKNLEPDEECLMTFIGMDNYRGRRTQADYTAFALTNKRFIISQKKRFTDHFVSVYWYHLNRIYREEDALLDVLVLDSVPGVFRIGLRKDRCEEIVDMANEIFKTHATHLQATPAAPASPVIIKEVVKEEPAAKSNVEQILEYKKLLDDGILTEEEFAAIKKKILGI
ncbi:MAG: SHOCT domain-containing protein [Lachnospiraceae bacterium]|nr:SHOCT domain-containing protein [Lachnospiraceae bacterium]